MQRSAHASLWRILPLPLLAVAVAAAAAVVTPVAASAAPPAACDGTVQVTDAVGDGHHTQSDIVDAWLSEASGSLQAVLRVEAATWQPEHTDEEVLGVSFAVLFTHHGTVRYVRVVAPPSPAAPTYEHGTWTLAGGFAPLGPTTGSLEPGTRGAVTIDVPASLGITAGTVLGEVFALSYDGTTSGVPHWVDQAPGGTHGSDVARGASYVVGSCMAAGGDTIRSIDLTAPARVVGGGPTTVTGRVVPARGGVDVRIAYGAGALTRGGTVTTAADGTFRARIPIRERTLVRASSESVASQTKTIGVQATIRAGAFVAVDRTIVYGVVRPALPGEVLLLRTDDVEPSATGRARNGAVRMNLTGLAPGRYQLVYIPANERAERVTSRGFTVARG